MVMKKIKIAVVTCYKDADYIRSRVIRNAFAKSSRYQPFVIKNSKTGFLKYPEVLWHLRKLLKTESIDAIFLNFRGYELLPFVLFMARKRPVIYDEFSQPVEAVEEHRMQKSGIVSWLMGLWKYFAGPYYWMLNHCALVLIDTKSHADYAARISRTNRSKYLGIPVSTDETIFKPGTPPSNDSFSVFFYGNVLPLHGLETILDAAVTVANDPGVSFYIVGGDRETKNMVKSAVRSGANISYEKYLPIEEIADRMRQSDLFIAGPLGDTPQAQHVITGKTYQSLACRVATVVGDNEDTAIYFDDKVNCLKVPQADAAALAKAIRWAAKNPQLIKNIAEKGHRTYVSTFSNESVAKQLFNALENVGL